MSLGVPKKTKFIHLGLVDYQKAWDYQEELFRQTIGQKVANRKLPESEWATTENFLIFCQHPHVYTLGKSGNPQHLLLDEKGLEALQAKYYKVNRGGDITYHGPGQIVGYPILDLDHFFTDIHKYLRYLEEAVILTLKDFDVVAGRIDGLTGVWTGLGDRAKAKKICAMGVKTSRWVTMHGFALNIYTDLSYFDHIVPCGIDDKAVTSLSRELGYDPGLKEVEEKLKTHLAGLFEMELT